MIVTVDGLSGSGKTTAAKAVARRLCWPILDSGMLYRAVAYMVLDRSAGHMIAEEVLDWCVGRVQLALDPDAPCVRVAGDDVPIEALRSAAVTAEAARLARVPEVRHAIVLEERRIAEGVPAFLCIGRDQGTVVFPNAAKKLVLVGDPVIRAGRLHRELLARGEAVDLSEVQAALERRDAADAVHFAALRREDGVVWINATHYDLPDLVRMIFEAIVGYDDGPWV